MEKSEIHPSLEATHIWRPDVKLTRAESVSPEFLSEKEHEQSYPSLDLDRLFYCGIQDDLAFGVLTHGCCVQRSLNMLLVDFDVVWSVLFSALRSM
jgi:hypothetical protein